MLGMLRGNSPRFNIGQNNYQYFVKVELRYMILQLCWESGTRKHGEVITRPILITFFTNQDGRLITQPGDLITLLTTKGPPLNRNS